jgi:predicted transcriptional regulator
MNSTQQNLKYINTTDGNTALQTITLSNNSTVYTKADRVSEDYVKQGLQCIPMLPHKKYPPYKWKLLQYKSNFLYWDKDNSTRHACNIAFYGDCNIGFITGAISNNVLAIDCDEWETYITFKDEFIRRIGRTRFTQSSRGGHILVRCTDAILTNTKIIGNDGKAIGDILGHSKIAVLPLSTKKIEGGEVFTYKDDPDSAADIIDTDLNTLQVFFERVAPCTIIKRYTPNHQKQHINISVRAQTFIDIGSPENERNNELFNTTSELLNHHQVDYVRRYMTDIADQHIPDEINQNQRTIESAIESYFDHSYYHSKKKRIGDLALEVLPALQFKGRVGETQKSVYKALAQRANQEIGKVEFVATYRQIQLLTNLRKNSSIKKALKNLCQRGVITHILTTKNKGYKEASKWKWNIRELTRLSASISSNEYAIENSGENKKVGHKVPISLTTKDAGYYAYRLTDFDKKYGQHYEQCLREPSALGNTGTDIYLYILNQHGGCRVSKIAEELQFHKRTVRRHIAKLKDLQMVERDGYMIQAQYNAIKVKSVLIKIGAIDSRQKHESNIQNERLWYAIDHVCIGRISKDKNHRMSKAQYIRKIINGEVIIEVLKITEVDESEAPPIPENVSDMSGIPDANIYEENLHEVESMSYIDDNNDDLLETEQMKHPIQQQIPQPDSNKNRIYKGITL